MAVSSPAAASLVRMVSLAERFARTGPQAEEAALRVLRSGQWVGGPEVSSCEREIAPMLGRKHAVGLNSGTDALILAMQALGVGPGDTVLVPALSFFATAGAVLRVGAQPVVVDTLEDRPLMDPQLAAGRCDASVKAAIPVHLFGMECPDPGLPILLIEDSAQALGQDPPAHLGIASALSFYATKTVGAAGDAGLLATDSRELAERVRRLANHGGVEGQAHLHELVAGSPGWNSRLDALQAALLRVQIPDLPARVARRRQINAIYQENMPSSCRAVPREPGDPIHHHILRCERRDLLREHLRAHAIESAVFYPRPLSAQPALPGQEPCPRAERWCAEILSLPCHECLSDQDLNRVLDALGSFLP